MTLSKHKDIEHKVQKYKAKLLEIAKLFFWCFWPRATWEAWFLVKMLHWIKIKQQQRACKIELVFFFFPSLSRSVRYWVLAVSQLQEVGVFCFFFSFCLSTKTKFIFYFHFSLKVASINSLCSGQYRKYQWLQYQLFNYAIQQKVFSNLNTSVIL